MHAPFWRFDAATSALAVVLLATIVAIVVVPTSRVKAHRVAAAAGGVDAQAPAASSPRGALVFTGWLVDERGRTGAAMFARLDDGAPIPGRYGLAASAAPVAHAGYRVTIPIASLAHGLHHAVFWLRTSSNVDEPLLWDVFVPVP